MWQTLGTILQATSGVVYHYLVNASDGITSLNVMRQYPNGQLYHALRYVQEEAPMVSAIHMETCPDLNDDGDDDDWVPIEDSSLHADLIPSPKANEAHPRLTLTPAIAPSPPNNAKWGKATNRAKSTGVQIDEGSLEMLINEFVHIKVKPRQGKKRPDIDVSQLRQRQPTPNELKTKTLTLLLHRTMVPLVPSAFTGSYGRFAQLSRHYRQALQPSLAQIFRRFLAVCARFYPAPEMAVYLADVYRSRETFHSFAALLAAFEDDAASSCGSTLFSIEAAGLVPSPFHPSSRANGKARTRRRERYFLDFWRRFVAMRSLYVNVLPVDLYQTHRIFELLVFLHSSRPFWIKPLDLFRYLAIHDPKAQELLYSGDFLGSKIALFTRKLTDVELGLLIPDPNVFGVSISQDRLEKRRLERARVLGLASNLFSLFDLQVLVYRGIIHPRCEFFLGIGQRLALSSPWRIFVIDTLDAAVHRTFVHVQGMSLCASELHTHYSLPSIELMQYLLDRQAVPSNARFVQLQSVVLLMQLLSFFGRAIFARFAEGLHFLEAASDHVHKYQQLVESFHSQASISIDVPLKQSDFERYVEAIYGFLWNIEISFAQIASKHHFSYSSSRNLDTFAEYEKGEASSSSSSSSLPIQYIPFTLRELMTLFSPRFHYYPIHGKYEQEGPSSKMVLKQYPSP